MSYNSGNIIIYPASKRNKENYPHSRISTERTITSNVRSLVSRSFIVDGLEATLSDSIITISQGSFILGGYNVTTSEAIEYEITSGDIGKYLSLSLKVRLSGNGNDELVGYDSDTSGLDSTNGKFLGLKIKLLDDLDKMVEEDKTNPQATYIEYSIPIVKITGIDSIEQLEDTDGKRLYEMRYDANDVYINNSFNHQPTSTEQSLSEYLDKYMFIDDGEIWMQMIKSRNPTSHTYDESTADEIIQIVKNMYYAQFEKLKSEMTKQEKEGE